MECAVVGIGYVFLFEGAKIWRGIIFLAWHISRCADGFGVGRVYIMGEEVVEGSVYEGFCLVSDIDSMEGYSICAGLDEVLVLGGGFSVAEKFTEEVRDLCVSVELYLKFPVDSMEVK